jgi:hypothetical protein
MRLRAAILWKLKCPWEPYRDRLFLREPPGGYWFIGIDIMDGKKPYGP